jgi:hypothetical protein
MRACTVCGSALTSRGGAPSNSILARAIRMGLAVCVGWGGGMVRGARLVTPGGVGAAGWQRVSKSPRPGHAAPDRCGNTRTSIVPPHGLQWMAPGGAIPHGGVRPLPGDGGWVSLRPLPRCGCAASGRQVMALDGEPPMQSLSITDQEVRTRSLTSHKRACLSAGLDPLGRMSG